MEAWSSASRPQSGDPNPGAGRSPDPCTAHATGYSSLCFQQTLLFSTQIHLFLQESSSLQENWKNHVTFQVLENNGAHKPSKNKTGIFNPA